MSDEDKKVYDTKNKLDSTPSLRFASQLGYLIVYAVVLMFGLITTGVVTLSLVSASYMFTSDDVHRKNASNMVRACAQVVQEELNANPNFTGFSPAEKTLYDRTNQNGTRSTCEVDNVTDGAENQKIFQLTAYEYRRSGDPKPIKATAQIVFESSVSLLPPPPSLPNLPDHLLGGVLIGYGGITSDGTGTIYTSRMNVLGKIYVDGSGDFRVENNGPLNVYNLGCGTTNWPEPCSTPPITRSGLARIYGSICAPGQIDTTNLYSLVPNCELPDISMPVFDKAGFIEALDGPTISANTIMSDGGCWKTQGTKDYRGQTFYVTAGATITGSLNMSSLPRISGTVLCRIVFQGDAYITGGITGNLDASTNVEFTLDSTVTEDITIVMNRQIYLDQPKNVKFLPNSSGKIAHVINFHSSNTTCSDSNTVPSLTVSTCLSPSEAKTSATSRTYAGLKMLGTNGTKNLSGMTIYTYYSLVDVGKGTGQFNIAGIAGQGLGGFDGTTDIRLSMTNPTFGIPNYDDDESEPEPEPVPEPGPPVFKIIDISLR